MYKNTQTECARNEKTKQLFHTLTKKDTFYIQTPTRIADFVKLFSIE